MRRMLSFRGRRPTDEVTLNKDELAKVRAIMKRWFLRSPRAMTSFFVIMLVPVAIYTVLLSLGFRVLIKWTAEHSVMRVMLPLFLTVIVSSLLVWIGVLLAYRIVWEPRYRQALRAIGYDLCEKCDYRLNGLDSDAPCPECGAERKGLSQPLGP